MAESSKNGKPSIPPYAPYSSFLNLMKRLQKDGLPAHIDRSTVPGSNSAKATMVICLNSLGLMNAAGEPSEPLKKLTAPGADYGAVLKEIIKQSYPWLFDGTIDLSKTTTEKLAEKLREFGTSGSTTSKCLAFLLAAAKDSGLTVSPYVKPLPVPKPVKKRPVRPSLDEAEIEAADDVSLDDQLGKERIVVSVHGMDDWIIYVPEGLTPHQWKHGLKMAKFILDNYRPDPDEAAAASGGAS
jgi:hypothetical protein